jgi:hypothetical protein
VRTPAGFDCKYFYANYFRGRNKQECRLVAGNSESERWNPGLCRTCPVPGLLRANACGSLVLDGRVVKTWGGLGRKVVVSAACTKTLQDVPRPEAGCGRCHEDLPKIFSS